MVPAAKRNLGVIPDALLSSVATSILVVRLGWGWLVNVLDFAGVTGKALHQ